MADPPPADRSRSRSVLGALVSGRNQVRASRPASLTSFVGREREVASVAALVRRPDVRLVTLTGPGGVGKTRLAREVAAVLERTFADGITFVELAPIRDPVLVVPTIAEALEVRDMGGQPVTERLVATLQHRQTLLVLDNLEQVVTAAPRLVDLLVACSALTILATSRTVLRVSGEHLAPVPPLAVASEASQLFIERARALQPDFAPTGGNVETIIDICRRLDGLPLAIELAAAWSVVLPPKAMLARLDQRLVLLTGGAVDQPQRLQSLRESIAWSHDLLDAAEQALFRRLAVFMDGFTLEAAAAVVGAVDDRAIDVLTGIASLAAKSLLRPEDGPDDEPRYWMLETVREYGIEQLGARGEESAVRDAHAAFFLTVAERAATLLLGGNPVIWLDRLAPDHNNLRAAFDHLCRAESAEICVRLAAACGWFWYRRGHIREGRTRLERALALGGLEPTAAKGVALRWAGTLALLMGDMPAATAHAHTAQTVWDAVGDPQGRALALNSLQMIAAREGRWDTAAALLEEALVVWQAVGEPLPIGMVLMKLGDAAWAQGNLARSRALVEEAAAFFLAADNRTWLAVTNGLLGRLAAVEGNGPEAAQRYRSCLRSHAAANEVMHVSFPLLGLAELAVSVDRPEAAARLLGAVDAQLQRTGAILDGGNLQSFERTEAAVRTALDRASYAAAYDVGRTDGPNAWLAEADRIVEDVDAAVGPERPPEGYLASGLTPREVDVLRLIAAGQTNREIAEILFISHGTVTTHVRHILAKLDVGSRTAVAAWAIRHGYA